MKGQRIMVDEVTVGAEESKAEMITDAENLTVMEMIALMVESPEVIQARMMQRFTEAETADELFGEAAVMDTVSSEDFVSTPEKPLPFILLATVSQGAIRPSNFQGSPFYMSMEVADPYNDTVFILNTSSPTCTIKVRKAMERGVLPQTLKLVKKDKPTAAGFYPLDLVYATPDEVELYKQQMADPDKF